MTYTKPAETTTAQLAKTVADEGWSVVGVLDRPLAGRLLRAVDDVASRASDAPGFWEQGGYHMHGDPWREERYGW